MTENRQSILLTQDSVDGFRDVGDIYGVGGGVDTDDAVYQSKKIILRFLNDQIEYQIISQAKLFYHLLGLEMRHSSKNFLKISL